MSGDEGVWAMQDATHMSVSFFVFLNIFGALLLLLIKLANMRVCCKGRKQNMS